MRRSLRTLVAAAVASSAVVAAGSPASALVACDATFHVVDSPSASAGDTELEAVDAWTTTNAWSVGTGNERGFSTHWNGSAWSKVPVPKVGEQSSLLEVEMAGPHDIWAVGSFVKNGKFRSLVMRRTSGGWARVATPDLGPGQSSLYRLAVIAPDDIWAGGGVNVGGVNRPLTLHWNGVKWTRVDFPALGDGDDYLEAMDAAGPGDVWVAVQFPNAGGVDRVATYHRVGSSWTRVAITQPSAGDVSPRDLLVLGKNSVWMTGFYDNAGKDAPLFEHWTGAHWAQVDGVAPSDFVYLEGMDAFGPHSVYVFGRYYEDPTTHSLVERFNGTSWAQVTSEDVDGALGTVPNNGAVVGSGADRRVWAVGYVETNDPRRSLIEQSCP